MSWPAVLLWAVIFAAAVSRGPWLIYALLLSGVFASLQMLPGSGGANLLPQSACAVVLVLKVMIQRGNVLRGTEAALDPTRLLLFTGFTVYAVLTALVLPRVFAGMIEVVPVSAFRFGTDILKPGSGNFTQSGYMALSYAVAVAFAVMGSTDGMRVHYPRALLWSGLALVGTGVLDLLTYNLGLGALLDPFRTATYAMLTDVEADGAKRVVGLTPEASTYGTSCVTVAAALTFLRPYFRTGREQLVVVGAIAALIVMVMLSTSSTAYVGLAVFGAIYGIDLLVRMADAKSTRRGHVGVEISLMGLIALAAFAAIVLKPGIFDPIVQMVDRMVFQKTATASFAERSFWTRVGWNAFLDSGGLGVGLGSIRVSNWAVSILGSTGLFGALLMFGFVAQQLFATLRHASPDVRRFATALKLSLLPVLCMYQLSGTIPDIGIHASIALGLIAAANMGPARSDRTRSEAGGPPDARGFASPPRSPAAQPGR